MNTRYFSKKIGSLPKGCRLCVEGAKLVLFITGLCPRSCYFCPISDQKYKKDVVYADEWPVRNIKQIIKEARLIDAKGAGITGGDPLCKPKRTLAYIRKLKKEFGNSFHIHLYTSLDLIDEKILKKLYRAGLDEIRFHLDFNDVRLWNRLSLARKYKWKVGVEVPVIPKKERQLKDMILFLDRKVDFLNLNELEIADNRVNKLARLGYKTKNLLSYGIKGSEELALKLLRFIKKKNINFDVHYCTAKLKDKVQLANRIKRRARNIKKEYDMLTKDGTLVRGAIYTKDLKPGIGYRKRLKAANKPKYIEKLKKIKAQLRKDFKIKYMDIDKRKLRLLTSVKTVMEIRDKVNSYVLDNIWKDKQLIGHKDLFLAVVEEYPTYDQLEITVEFL